MRKSFVFYRGFAEAVKHLPKTKRLMIYEAIIDYGLNGTEPECSGIISAFFPLIKPQLDANIKRYDNRMKRELKSETGLNL